MPNCPCNRKAHRYPNIAYKFFDESGTKQTATAADASFYGARFASKPWSNIEKIKDLTFNLGETTFQAKGIKDLKGASKNCLICPLNT
jgi:hypothetical protein